MNETEFHGRLPCSVCKNKNCSAGPAGYEMCVWHKARPFYCQNLPCKFISYDPITGEFNCYLGFEQQCHAATPPQKESNDVD